MSRSVCPRAWEAQAIEDGRLDEVARASFERHATTCEPCAHERSVWLRLRQHVKRLPRPTSTSLERRRLRMALLNRANRRTMTEPTSFRMRVGLIAGVCLLVAASASYPFFRRGPAATTLASSTYLAPVFDVHPAGNAEWHLDRAGAESQLRLTEGAVALHVDKLDAGQRFVVLLPDGELEVRGTRFVAEVRRGQTERVEVTEGSVILRLGSREIRTLGPGEIWHRERPPDEGAVGAAPPSAPHEPSATAPARDEIASRARVGTNVLPTASSAAHEARAADGTVFVAAMSAFDAGDYERAEELFAEFERRAPGDARNEDVDFLLILLRRRMGDAKGARRYAHAYLARHPKGLRQAEVETFLGQSSSSTGENR